MKVYLKNTSRGYGEGYLYPKCNALQNSYLKRKRKTLQIF
uniref:Uncharacterized protein n=1 Tax=Rhizophora mucronata TaxID=61149 RepID=A0A2P2KKH3_RHIMU